MRYFLAAAALAASLVPSSASAAAFVLNVKGVVSSLEGSASKLKVGDALDLTLTAATLSADVFPQPWWGFFYITEATGHEQLGSTKGTIATQSGAGAQSSSVSNYVKETLTFNLSLTRSAADIFDGAAGSATETVGLGGSARVTNQLGDAVTGITATDADYHFKYLTQSFAASSGETLKVGYSNITFSLSPPSAAVPEPTTWAMLILGFGAVGASLRRKRRTIAVGAV